MKPCCLWWKKTPTLSMCHPAYLGRSLPKSLRSWPCDRPSSHPNRFSTRLSNSRGVILASKTEEEPRPSRKATARPRVGYPKELEQVTHAHTFLNTVIMNCKSTLVNQITCLTVEHLHQPDLPQAGRLAHHVTNWSAITQDQWVLNTVQGY